VRSHIQRTVAGCFAALRQIRGVRRSLPLTPLETLAVTLVLTRLDYGNATLAGNPSSNRAECFRQDVHRCTIGAHQHVARRTALQGYVRTSAPVRAASVLILVEKFSVPSRKGLKGTAR